MIPPIAENSALFLDIDGTLLDLAAQPGMVVIPPGLPALLHRHRAHLGGAVAFISGRPLKEIDGFFPGNFPAAAEHGAAIRDAEGQLHHVTERPAAYESWLEALRNAAATMPGVLIEEKTVGIVIHYRQAPQFGEAILALTQRLAVQAGPSTHLLKAHMAYELRAAGASKDRSLAWFMDHPPFAGRTPIFIGDDTTDEPAIELATELGGHGLHVARDFGGSPEGVREWLRKALLFWKKEAKNF